jgi:hypothetical protein
MPEPYFSMKPISYIKELRIGFTGLCTGCFGVTPSGNVPGFMISACVSNKNILTSAGSV